MATATLPKSGSPGASTLGVKAAPASWLQTVRNRNARPASTQGPASPTDTLTKILNSAGLGGGGATATGTSTGMAAGSAAAGAGGGGTTPTAGGTVPGFVVPGTNIQTSGNPTTNAASNQLQTLAAQIAAQQGKIDPTLAAQMAKYAELYSGDPTKRLMDQAASAQRDLAAGMGLQGDIRGAMTGTGPGTGAGNIGSMVARNVASSNAQIAKDELARKAGLLSSSNALALTPTQTGLQNQAQLAELAKALGGLGIEQGNLALGQGKLGLDAQIAAMDAYLKKYGIDVGAQTAKTGNILDLYRALYGMAL